MIKIWAKQRNTRKIRELKSLPSNGNIFPTFDPSPTIKLHFIHYFDDNDNPSPKHPNVCMEELHTFLAKQHNFNMDIKIILYENSSRVNFLLNDLETSMDAIRCLSILKQMIALQEKYYKLCLPILTRSKF